MNKWILCVILSSIVGSMIYGLWWLLTLLLGKLWKQNDMVDVMYYTLRAAVILFAGMVFAGLGCSMYLELIPSQTYWGVETPLLRQLLNGMTMMWAVGAIYRLLRYLWEYVSLHRRVKGMRPGRESDQQVLEQVCGYLGMNTRVQIYQYSELVVPELSGIGKAQILLPDREYTEEQLVPILTHELIHHKYHDRLIREAAVLTHCIHWWNPLVPHLHRTLAAWDELHCDACVCDCDHIRKKDYASILYQISEQVVTHRQILHTALAEGGGDMVERMQQILSHRKGRAHRRGLTVVVTLLLVLCSGGVSLAAGTGVIHLYDLAVDLTIVEEQEQLQPLKEWVEYEVYVGEEFLQTLENGDAQIQAQPSGYISATLVNSRWSTGAFQASAGQVISVGVMPDLATVQMKVGILEPDGYLRYMMGTGNIMHDFALDQTGDCYVIVQNDTSTKVTVVGSYQTRDVK
ncbi:MAG: M56 family metallopeptidase [Lachnospiraceae bacterium]|nr:M56 family metallopeptidase [Lachnospiraceae bacterium]